ncbi:MAG: hypothetical protein IJC16_09335 [Rikenellaceae bacterium]|nr:hypothetical protein [Rikenellaceae bacterium]
MMLHEKALRTGRWFARRRRYIPWVYALLTIVALLLATPFSLWRSSVWLTVPSLMLAVGGFALRFAARRRNGCDPASLIAARGIYSVLRFPRELGNYLIICGITLYSGLTWYIFFIPIAGIMIMHRIALADENSLAVKFGDTYLQWCRTTNAFSPVFTSWEKSTCPLPLRHTLLAESQMIFLVIAGFTAVNGLKYLMIHFSLRFDPFWLVLFVIALVLALLGHLLRK